MAIVKSLNEEILETCKVKDIEFEIEESYEISERALETLGLLSPFTIQWKVLFQVLCNERTDWDEQLSDGHLKRWNSLVAELQTLNSVRIPICYFDSHSASQFDRFEDQDCTIKETEHPQA